MVQTHDIFLRAYAVRARVKKQRKRNASGTETEKWPEFALVFDTETRITADQSLTFGVYRLCKLVADDYEVTEEGIFYADDLSPAELRVLKKHVDASVADVNGFPSQFARLLLQYREHPEAKSLAPDGSPCKADTSGLLRRAHVFAGEFRYVGKETDRKWEEGEDTSVLDFKATEYGRTKRVVASEEVKNEILKIGINKCARESGFDRKNFVRKLVRGIPVKRKSCDEFLRWLKQYKSHS